jgi:coenzyme Q-binding protein COQ10
MLASISVWSKWDASIRWHDGGVGGDTECCGIFLVPSFKTQKRVNVPASLAYAVAADVGKYREFLPLLERSVVRGAVTEKDGVTSFSAELAAGYAKLNIRESFVSKVTCDSTSQTVTATSQDHPFKDMKTVWSIRDVNGQSDVSISIDYSMRSMMVQMVLAGVMEMAVAKVMSAFEARALSLHKQSAIS